MNYIYYSNELYHHGIKGQKWGLRRWQNEDGSLTAEGRIHYGYGSSGGTKDAYKNAKRQYNQAKISFSKSWEGNDNDEINRNADRVNEARAKMRQAKMDYRSDKNIRKAEQRAWKQQRRDYIKTKSTGERLATGLLLGPVGLYNYNSLMAAGSSGGNKLVNFGKAFATTTFTGGFGNMVYSSIIANKEKEKY